MEETPPRVREYADQTVAYVRRALGVPLEYDSDTLPLLDHYLRTVPESATAPEAVRLVIATAAAYFGEVVRRRLGGRWDLTGEETEWRMFLPTGLNFSPAGFVASAIARADLADLDSEFDAPPRMKPYVEQALERMGVVSVDEYYSLCGRLDTLEHVHEVLVAVAAQMMGENPDGAEPPETGEPAEPEVPEVPEVPVPVADEPSGAVN
jgi:hypothetical protein